MHPWVFSFYERFSVGAACPGGVHMKECGMSWFQQTVQLSPKARGFHLVTDEVMSQVETNVRVGLMHLFIQHTSASLTLNENASRDVRGDFERHFRRMVPDGADYFRHTLEGPDDMPAHIKASLLGFSLSIPIKDGRPMLGTWQGIYLCEHRERGGSRKITVTIHGDE